MTSADNITFKQEFNDERHASSIVIETDSGCCGITLFEVKNQVAAVCEEVKRYLLLPWIQNWMKTPASHVIQKQLSCCY